MKSSQQPSDKSLTDSQSIRKQVVEDGRLENSALQQQALRIAQAMQTTLDIYSLLRKFNKELKSYVSYHSLQYKHPTTDHQFMDGVEMVHKISYNLKLEQDILGTMVITRDTPFDEGEIKTIETAIAQIVYPLKNSLAYHQALVSSLTCPLTKLGNRHAYDCAIAKELDFCKRHEVDLCLLVLDLDKFKIINDTYGHLAGDTVLVEAAERLSTACRDSDIVFRYGGEEFVVILKNCSNEGAMGLAKRIAHILSSKPVTWENHTIDISACIGLASLSPQDTKDSLFLRADTALFKAKRLGKSQIQQA